MGEEPGDAGGSFSFFFPSFPGFFSLIFPGLVSFSENLNPDASMKLPVPDAAGDARPVSPFEGIITIRRVSAAPLPVCVRGGTDQIDNYGMSET
ncbi:hypothetical protein BJX62DRAFT_192104 [Aspergillus germanicus]